MSKEELRAVREEIFSINSFAEVIETVQSRVDLKRILGVSSFSIEKTLEARALLRCSLLRAPRLRRVVRGDSASEPALRSGA